MEYEFAKKLKDAGFPQFDLDYGRSFYEDGEDIKNPTLSELIEACADKFCSLEKIDAIDANFIARTFERVDRKDEFQTEFLGDTPEEAVANLWLSLNKK